MATKIIASMPGKRVRGSTSGRPIMAAMDLLGRRGALRIVWELRDGEGATFRALSAASELPPGTLNTRLSELRTAQIITADNGYRLTSVGRDLIDALMPLLHWSEEWASKFR